MMGELLFRKLGFILAVILISYTAVVLGEIGLDSTGTAIGSALFSGFLGGNKVIACVETCAITQECMDCLGEFGVCNETSHNCTCDLQKSVPSLDGTTCLPIKNEIGGECKESLQCQEGVPGSLSECTEGKCNCTVDGVTDGKGDHCYERAWGTGDKCEVTSQCTANLVLSDCYKGACRCWPGTVDGRGAGGMTRCYWEKELGDKCEVQAECRHDTLADTGAGCFNGTCACRDGYGLNPTDNNNTSCMKWATVIGDLCDQHPSQCGHNLEGAACVEQGGSYTCRCNSTTQLESTDKKSCLSIKNLNEICTERQQCTTVYSNCTGFPDGNRCSCTSGYVQGVESPNKCLRIRSAMGASCEEDVQCRTDDTFYKGTLSCVLGVCDCKPTEQYTSRLCIAPLKLNSTCNFTEQCILGGDKLSWCAGNNNNNESDSGDKWCQCNSKAIEVGGICFEEKRVGDDCETGFECSVGIEGTVRCSRDDGCTCVDKDFGGVGGVSCPFVDPGLGGNNSAPGAYLANYAVLILTSLLPVLIISQN